MQYLTWILVALASCAVFSGCGQQQRPGFPAQSYDQKQLIEDLETKFDLPTKIRRYYDQKPALALSELKIRRNEIIISRITLINLHYNQFVADASFRRQMMDFGADIADLGVDLATTVVGSAATKTILGAISAGITGSQASVHKNFYFEKTVSAIVATMNASRKQALIPILTGQQRGVDSYPLGQALSDLDNYYFAGTFLGALNAILLEAGENEKAANTRIDRIRHGRFTQTITTHVIERWLWPNGPPTSAEPTPLVNQDGVDRLNAWLGQPANLIEGEKLDMATLLYEAAFEDVRQRVIQELINAGVQPNGD